MRIRERMSTAPDESPERSDNRLAILVAGLIGVEAVLLLVGAACC